MVILVGGGSNGQYQVEIGQITDPRGNAEEKECLEDEALVSRQRGKQDSEKPKEDVDSVQEGCE